MLDPYARSDAPFGPVERALRASFRVGSVAGTELRVYYTAVLVTAWAAWELSRWPGVGLGEALLVGGGIQVGVYLIVLGHEAGHALAGRRYGIPTPTITLSALGGLAHFAAPSPGPRAEIVTSAAGPVTHVPWIALGLLLEGRVAPLSVGTFGIPVDLPHLLWTTNAWLLGFNLLPLFPLDGGRVLRGALATRWHPNRATLLAARLGAVGGIGFMAWGLSRPGVSGTLLVLIGVRNLVECLRELQAARWSDGPYGEALAPWEQDADAWKQGAARDDDPRPARGLLAALRRRRARRPPAPVPPPAGAPTPGSAADEAELDRLLEKVSRVGLPGLSEAERAALQRISAARRGR